MAPRKNPKPKRSPKHDSSKPMLSCLLQVYLHQLVEGHSKLLGGKMLIEGIETIFPCTGCSSKGGHLALFRPANSEAPRFPPFFVFRRPLFQNISQKSIGLNPGDPPLMHPVTGWLFRKVGSSTILSQNFIVNGDGRHWLVWCASAFQKLGWSSKQLSQSFCSQTFSRKTP